MNARRRLIAAALLAASPAFAAEPVIKADARLDLVGLLQRLSGDPHSPSNPESDAAAAHFARWAKHPAVTHLAKMHATGFDWDHPLQYAVYLSTPPSLREIHPTPDFFAQLAGGRDSLDAWREEASDFARVSGFLKWETERAPRRDAELAAVGASSAGVDLSSELVHALGVKPWASWTVYVSPFFPHGGGGSWVIEEKPGRPDVVVMYGPLWNGDKPASDPPWFFAAGVLPEAVFSMTYAVYEVCRPEIRAAASVCQGMQGMANPEDCVQQIWVRGLVARLIDRRYGPGASANYRRYWPPTPFQEKADAVYAVYEGDRAKYKDLMDASGILLAPFQPGGRAPECRLVDRARWPETVYTRRLAYFLDARLEARPDAELRKVLSELPVEGK
ncbi:MAG: hypothetical protein ACHQ51_13810 [Elusimicrobiota bacterium]